MPRNRNLDEASNAIQNDEVDYLDVDKPLPGQNYYCISFISPDKILNQKEQYFFHHYEKKNIDKFYTLFNTKLDELINKCEDGTVDISEIILLKKQVEDVCTSETCTFDKFKEKYEDFKFADEEHIGEDFDKNNNFQTSIRGVKVRGVFDTKREADVRAAVLQRQDINFDVFVGQVGYWCPWDPNPQKIADVEYVNKELNTLMKEYKANAAKKDQFYEEQKRERQKDATVLTAEDRIKHRHELQKTLDEQKELEKKQLEALNTDIFTSTTSASLINTSDIDLLDNLVTVSSQENNTINSLDIGCQDSKEISVEAQEQQLMSDDPWLQRKLQEQQQQ